MAKDKKGFVLYCDYIGVFEQLSDREAGLLIKHILAYVNDKNPESDSRIVNMAFEPIKLQLKRDLVRYETTRERRSEAGKLGGRPKQNKAEKANAFSEKQTKAKKAETVIVTDTVTVTGIDSLSEIEAGATIQFCLFTLNRTYDNKKVDELWKAFLINGQEKNYASREKKIRHFRNWIKNQPYANGKTHQRNPAGSDRKGGTSTDRIDALGKWGLGRGD